MSEWSYRPTGHSFFWRGKWREVYDVFLPGDTPRWTRVDWDIKDSMRDSRRRNGQPGPPRPKYELDTESLTPQAVEDLVRRILAGADRPDDPERMGGT